ncbi:MAG: alanine dehydrogenase [Myxococcales bacterium]|nr:alanine dehydrogenase [Myxococcales bacterium]
MKIGVPKEIKDQEYRVALAPGGVRELVEAGHEVWIETQAGAGIGADDDSYRRAGARVVETAREVFETANLVLKVKEPQPRECGLLRPGQVLFTFLHLAADREQAKALLASGATAIAYETVRASDGTLPLLTPMSEVAGRMSVQVGAYHLQKNLGGAGLLLGGVPGVAPARVVVLGGGVAGTGAVEMALGLRADVTIVDLSVPRLRQLDEQFDGAAKTAYSTRETIEQLVGEADLVVGAVLVAGAAAPKLVSASMVESMREGAVMVDISIDQGGCFETSRPTTHSEPTYVVDGVVHYCVTNIPGAVPRTSTSALMNATLPYIRKLAAHGWEAALENDANFAAGLNIHNGNVTHPAVAEALGLPLLPWRS